MLLFESLSVRDAFLILVSFVTVLAVRKTFLCKSLQRTLKSALPGTGLHPSGIVSAIRFERVSSYASLEGVSVGVAKLCICPTGSSEALF